MAITVITPEITHWYGMALRSENKWNPQSKPLIPSFPFHSPPPPPPPLVLEPFIGVSFSHNLILSLSLSLRIVLNSESDFASTLIRIASYEIWPIQCTAIFFVNGPLSTAARPVFTRQETACVTARSSSTDYSQSSYKPSSVTSKKARTRGT